MLHDILKDFPGSQDGTVTEEFKAGTQRELSDYLAACVVPYGWARPVGAPAVVVNKAVATESQPQPARTKRGK